MVRYDTEDDEALTFAADWAATLTNRVRKMDSINLWLPRSIKRSTGKSSMPSSISRVLPGLHKGRTAVITGGVWVLVCNWVVSLRLRVRAYF